MAIIDNLVSYYKLDENAATTNVLDSHVDNDGTANANTNTLYDANGKINSCFDFDGANEIVVPYDASLYNTEFTISVWVYSTSSGGDGYYIVNWDTPLSDFAGLRQNGDGIGMTIYVDDDVGLPSARQGASLTQNAWVHVVATLDAVGDLKIYIDGDLKDTTRIAGDHAWDNEALYFGDKRTGSGDRAGFEGKIDELAIFNVDIGQAGVTALYNSGNGLAYPFTVGTNIQINRGDVWKEVPEIKINIGNVWKDVVGIQLNIGNTWKEVF